MIHQLERLKQLRRERQLEQPRLFLELPPLGPEPEPEEPDEERGVVIIGNDDDEEGYIIFSL